MQDSYDDGRLEGLDGHVEEFTDVDYMVSDWTLYSTDSILDALIAEAEAV